MELVHRILLCRHPKPGRNSYSCVIENQDDKGKVHQNLHLFCDITQKKNSEFLLSLKLLRTHRYYLFGQQLVRKIQRYCLQCEIILLQWYYHLVTQRYCLQPKNSSPVVLPPNNVLKLAKEFEFTIKSKKTRCESRIDGLNDHSLSKGLIHFNDLPFLQTTIHICICPQCMTKKLLH